ncbi:MAG TPA: amidase [Ktedonobacteraceae bacterium]|nr:amidase [Ktedonobacteraceae bacterium]
MLITPNPLAETATALHNDQLNLVAYINEICERIDTIESLIAALLPEPERRSRLIADAIALQERFPDPANRPPLYGIPVGVKDMFRVDGFPTRAGSRLPPELFAGPEADCVRALREAGALILGKTISTEFAFFEPGPTRNPYNPAHTPGGSSSGSAAAVAAGYCPLALGTQTIGSTIRPAAFCGIVGFKPSYGHISTAGLIKCAASVDTVGFFTQDVAGIATVAPLLCHDWQTITDSQPLPEPVLGVPDGPYLAQASAEGLAAFEKQLALLTNAGYRVRRMSAMRDIEAINARHMRMVSAEMAQVHVDWFAQYAPLYRPRTAEAIREGQRVSAEELSEYRAGRLLLRQGLEQLMQQNGIDLWVCPSAPGPAPEGIKTTGNSIMNLPWTHAGLPAISLPAGCAENGLPLGLQCIGAYMADEHVVFWAERLAHAISPSV